MEWLTDEIEYFVGEQHPKEETRKSLERKDDGDNDDSNDTTAAMRTPTMGKRTTRATAVGTHASMNANEDSQTSARTALMVEDDPLLMGMTDVQSTPYATDDVVTARKTPHEKLTEGFGRFLDRAAAQMKEIQEQARQLDSEVVINDAMIENNYDTDVARSRLNTEDDGTVGNISASPKQPSIADMDDDSNLNLPPIESIKMPVNIENQNQKPQDRVTRLREQFWQLPPIDVGNTRWNQEQDTAFDPDWNCYGVVHVRVIAATNLPCPVGSSVQAIVSLWPWKGKVRPPAATSFPGVDNSGVCVLWHEDRLEEDEDEESGAFMVHAHSDDDTPIPKINIDLVFRVANLMELSMSNLELTTEPMLRKPTVWHQQWLQTNSTATSPKNGHAEAKNKTAHPKTEPSPLILLEAAFFPARETDEDTHTEERQEQQEQEQQHRHLPDIENSDICEGGTSTMEEEDDDDDSDNDENDTGNDDDFETMSALTGAEGRDGTRSVSSKRTAGSARKIQHGMSATRSVITSTPFLLQAKSKTHHMQVISLWVPSQCLVCGKSILGWKRAHRCEVCKVDCCTDCLIQVDLQLPCGSSMVKDIVENSEQRQWTVDKIMSTIAPDDGYGEKKLLRNDDSGLRVLRQHHNSPPTRPSKTITRPITTTATAAATTTGAMIPLNLPRSLGADKTVATHQEYSGVGKIHISIDRACLLAAPLPLHADTGDLMATMMNSDRRRGLKDTGKKNGFELRPADHYVRISQKGTKATKRTRTVQNSARPNFAGSAEMTMDV